MSHQGTIVSIDKWTTNHDSWFIVCIAWMVTCMMHEQLRPLKFKVNCYNNGQMWVRKELSTWRGKQNFKNELPARLYKPISCFGPAHAPKKSCSPCWRNHGLKCCPTRILNRASTTICCTLCTKTSISCHSPSSLRTVASARRHLERCSSLQCRSLQSIFHRTCLGPYSLQGKEEWSY